ncbi:RagB/SusD family nutrient uptake outer membrane protein [Pontibacter harenae]|uniref:RagB/SusD family nutrient uptake outer membrane protein n=1 Tax=Pontibacter harenae TaxID=2894083 RepID=UPI001E53857B|nr:RagB/SusD family nutrient uptake outer membrane protein [Pontibacter harenae]MCC9166192.1 RagB/SusD family nutrient uptake outer membrane protein [Pontibacter harenae]
MKINKIILGIGLSCALALPACESVIEVGPEFAEDGSQIFTSLNDYELALTGAYSLFRQVGYFGNGGQTTGAWSVLPDLMSDNLVQTAEDLANWQNQINLEYSTDDADVAASWIAAYSVIGQANLVLRNIEQFSETDPERVNRIKGQALAIRGMVHFDLLRYWGVEFERNSTALGVPYKTIVDINDMPRRLTVEETYDNIFRDLEEAETLLGDVDQEINTSNRAYIDQLTVQAILARVNLYAEEYAAAESYATMVIEQMPLADMDDFQAIWGDASTEEVIWAVSFNAGEGSPASSVFNAPSNRNRARPATPLLESYDMGDDIRYGTYFSTRSLSGNSRNILSKFIGRGSAEDNLVDWKVFRTGEMYLIRAEARARQAGKEALGLADLNELRAARIVGYTPVNLSGQALLDAIALERRKELVGEGHRFFDLKRTTRTLTRTDSDLASTNLSVSPDAIEWVWPIPQGEIDANPNIADQQTPGYN